MTVQCADCGIYVCRVGSPHAAPDDCPMRGDFPDFEEMYPDRDTRTFVARSALVEAEGYGRWTRAREVVEFAAKQGYRKIGVAHCSDMRDEALRVAAFLKAGELDPVLPGESGEDDSSRGTAPPGDDGGSATAEAGESAPDRPGCDPVGQARRFAAQGTEMNLLAGMSVAHEALFIRESQVPVVGLIARDTRLRHNPAAAIYTSRSYLKKELFGHWKPAHRPPFLGTGRERLEEVAEELQAGDPTPRSRLSEAMEVAYRLGIDHLGISFCVGFRNEAGILSRLLRTNGFRVSSACCKTGSVPKEEMGISDAQKVRPGKREMICNPITQAELLNREGVQLTLVLGQCVGHDAATFAHLESPGICLVAKDRVLGHNTLAGIP